MNDEIDFAPADDGDAAQAFEGLQQKVMAQGLTLMRADLKSTDKVIFDPSEATFRAGVTPMTGTERVSG